MLQKKVSIMSPGERPATSQAEDITDVGSLCTGELKQGTTQAKPLKAGLSLHRFTYK